MLLTSYIFLNLVVGIIVAAMEEIVEQDQDHNSEQQKKLEELSQQLTEIKAMLENLRK